MEVRGIPQEESLVSMERLKFEVPDRSGLPELQKYAHLVIPAMSAIVLLVPRKQAGGASICAGIVRLCRFITAYFESCRAEL